MRAAWIVAGAVAAVATSAAPARADGTVTLRGVWFKEKATRIIQPMLDGWFEVGDRDQGEVTVHALVDSITSASVAAGALDEPFAENRWEVGGGYLHRLGRTRVGGFGRVSHEPDYDSVFGGMRGDVELMDRMVVLGASVGYGNDWIGKTAPGGMGEPFAEEMSTFLGSLSYTQILSPTLVGGITYDLIRSQGYLANPYRSAITAEGLADERHPDERTRQALAASLRWFVTATSTAVIASHRVYRDDWEIWAHTPELRIVQEAGDGLDVAFRYRYYWQTEAFFFERSYPSASVPYLTDDVKLSRFTTHTIGVKFGGYGWVLGLPGLLADARGELTLEYTDQNNRFGNAVEAHVAVTLPLVY